MNSKIAKKIKRGVSKYGDKYTGGIIEKQPREQRNEYRRYMDRCRNALKDSEYPREPDPQDDYDKQG